MKYLPKFVFLILNSTLFFSITFITKLSCLYSSSIKNESKFVSIFLYRGMPAFKRESKRNSSFFSLPVPWRDQSLRGEISLEAFSYSSFNVQAVFPSAIQLGEIPTSKFLWQKNSTHSAAKNLIIPLNSSDPPEK